MCSSSVCNNCCDCKQDCCGIDIDYLASVYTGFDDTIKDSVDAINHVRQDQPTLGFDVVCSHLSGGKNKSRIVTFRQTYVIQILSYRNLSMDPMEFLVSLDRIHSGEVAINYQSDIRLLSEQHTHIPKFITILHSIHQHRDNTCSVTPRLLGANSTHPRTIIQDDNVGRGDFDYLANYSSSPKSISYTPWDDHVYSRKPWTQTDVEFYVKSQSSLGTWSSIYRANQTQANACVRCSTSPCCFTACAWFCLMPCFLWCWHHRYKRVTYKSSWVVVLPDFKDFETECKKDPELYALPVNHLTTTPAPAQTPLGRIPLNIQTRLDFAGVGVRGNGNSSAIYGDLEDELPMPYHLTPIGTPQ